MCLVVELQVCAHWEASAPLSHSVLASCLQHVLAELPHHALLSELAQCNQNHPKSTSKAGQQRDLMHRRATRLIQHSWRAMWALRNRAAVQIQSALRMHLAKQHLRRSCCAACVIQACSIIPGTCCRAESHIARIRCPVTYSPLLQHLLVLHGCICSSNTQ